MSDLFSLKGLITITVSSLISIKTLRLNVKVSRDINVQGSGNIVIVNNALAPIQKSFKLLWQMLVLLIAFTYPILGPLYNSVLQTFALIGVPIAFISLIVTMRAYGAYRIWDVFYVLGAAIACWLAYSANLYLVNTAANASQIYPMAKSLLGYGLPIAGQWSTWLGVVLPLAYRILTVVGFAALFLSLLYLVFAYLTERNFDGAARFSLHYLIMSTVGFLAACDGLTALMVRDFAYLGRLIGTAWPF
ncbi:hypothetical protein [Paraburkholderia tropica]|uniref:Uncharacterized protein n=1 Tax=Paraburkholderia tropica TaxID=92647 RepID=A0AAQ1GKQ7_9BURK|nr:hypothetical protein [Paraburkholderia tropica]RQN40808.1 hypothetical protein EHZ25_00670 [Paraburkholderia tropica]SEK09361.1 hypothetical protein SAMN05216550_117187 [Paraburkholderia tropica]